MKHKLLVADDEIWVRELLFEILKDDYEVTQAADGQQAWELLQEDQFSIALLDLRMPGMDGLEVLENMDSRGVMTVPVVITANKDVDSAVRAMKLGAYDYVIKPFDNEKLLILVKNALEKYRLQSEVRNLREVVRTTYKFENVIAESPAMQRIMGLVSRVLDNDSTLLITGESGTGKEVMARIVHYNSIRKDKPFIALDCAAIPDTLIENELFGHEKGAFTGAMTRGIGKFELANNGTIFLDEIGNLRLDVQAKLLRVLQEREFTRIGGSEKIRIDVRIICATNSNLVEEIREGRFREDLYYRINVVPIVLPPLRDRGADVEMLIRFFLNRFNVQLGKKIGVSKEAMRILTRYSWPGNVRELENMMHRLVIVRAEGELQPDDLPDQLHAEPETAPAVFNGSPTLQELEFRYIMSMIEQEKGNISRAARVLGVTRKTLHNKLNRFQEEGRIHKSSEGWAVTSRT